MDIKTITEFKKIFLNTGNILSLNDITKKPGQNPTEEVCTVHVMVGKFLFTLNCKKIAACGGNENYIERL